MNSKIKRKFRLDMKCRMINSGFFEAQQSQFYLYKSAKYIKTDDIKYKKTRNFT